MSSRSRGDILLRGLVGTIQTNPPKGTIVVHDTTKAYDYKLPTAAKQTGIAGVIVKPKETVFGTAPIEGVDEVVLAGNGETADVLIVGPVNPGDPICIANTSGYGKKANPAPGEIVGIIGYAEEVRGAQDDICPVNICPGQFTGGLYAAAGAPGVNNDGVDTAGAGRYFVVGSTWINTSNGVVYVCTSAATGAAAWTAQV